MTKIEDEKKESMLKSQQKHDLLECIEINMRVHFVMNSTIQYRHAQI